MNILICDDNPADAVQIEDSLQHHCHAIAVSMNFFVYTDSLQIESLQAFDIAFLDIDMPEQNGITLARKLHELKPDAVIIFVTNFVQYAPEGYEVRAFRYLLKADLAQKLIPTFDLAVDEVVKKHQCLTISINSEPLNIPLQDILYLESHRRIIILHLIHEEDPSYQFYRTITELSDKLEPFGFLRIQKSYLVNMNYIEAFRYGNVQLKGGKVLTSSEKNHTELKRRYLQWKGQSQWSIY